MIEPLLDEDYRELLLLRTGLRRFLHQSETWAHDAGLTPAQHQLLLAIRGHDVREGPTIGNVADYLLLRHHSAVELVDRAVSAGLVVRLPDPKDARAVRLALTPTGSSALARLAQRNREELARLADRFRPLWHDLEIVNSAETTAGSALRIEDRITVGRVYEPVAGVAHRILVDRLWPRGLANKDVAFEWRQHLAPSTSLRRWYGHAPERFEEFARRYREELETVESTELKELATAPTNEHLVLLTATKDVDRSGATVLAAVLRSIAENSAASRKPRRAARSHKTDTS